MSRTYIEAQINKKEPATVYRTNHRYRENEGQPNQPASNRAAVASKEEKRPERTQYVERRQNHRQFPEKTKHLQSLGKYFRPIGRAIN
jgi:hypothetical protein